VIGKPDAPADLSDQSELRQLSPAGKAGLNCRREVGGNIGISEG
jgi:hypothetical protein